jgi:hypothetical protein
MLIPILDIYYRAGAFDKGNALAEILLNRYGQEIEYFSQFSGINAAYIGSDLKEAAQVVKTIGSMAFQWKQNAIAEKAKKILTR